MTTEEETSDGSNYGVSRILGLSDAVFAFVVTLLVLDLVVPSLPLDATSSDLWEALSSEWIHFLDYGISFLIAGAWWNAHHRIYHYIRESDATLRSLNLFFLLWITLLPFFTRVFSENPTIQLGYILYAIDQAAAGFTLALLWWYASRNHRLVDKNLSDEVIRSRLLVSALASLWFIFSIGFTFISLGATYLFWFSVFLLRRINFSSKPKRQSSRNEKQINTES
jgi:uncharacterized membrane protein